MNANEILQADVLDIIFEHKNKNYGAYDLRKNYTNRLLTALFATITICVLFFISSKFFAKEKKLLATTIYLPPDVNLDYVKNKEVNPEVIPSKPKPLQEIKVKTEIFTEPEIVNTPTNPPTTQADLETDAISDEKQDGIENTHIITPPNKTTTVVQDISIPRREYVFAFVEQQATYPGGEAAWKEFLERNLNSNLPIANGAPTAKYVIVVSFLVDRRGNISEIKAENDPGYGLAEEAIRVIKKSQQWEPAQQKGIHVKYRQRLQIVFEIRNNN